jgi:DNA-binding transcriptional LysR family regulator
MMTIFLPKSADLAGVSRFQVGDEYLGHLVQSQAQILVPQYFVVYPPRARFLQRKVKAFRDWLFVEMGHSGHVLPPGVVFWRCPASPE